MTQRMGQGLARIWRAWERFWFETDGRAQMRVFRVLLGLVLLVCYAIRSLDLDLYYGEHGLMTLKALPDLLPLDYRYSVFYIFTSRTALWIGNGLFLASLLSFTLGLLPRLSVIVALVLHVSFVHRNLAVCYGVDLIACFMLFFMCFADFRHDREYRAGDLWATLGSVALRLCQIQVCVIYAYSGLKKLKGQVWWQGDAIWASLADPLLARWDFSWLAHFPLVLTGFTFLTLAWEIYFPALVWIRPIRKPVLVIGILLHLGIAVGLNLPFFASLMVSTYCLFLDRQTLVQGTIFFEKLKNKLISFKVPRPVSD